MAAPVHLPPTVLSKPWAEPSAESDSAFVCVFSAEGACAEAPLTSEPPLPDAEPLTSEPPLSDAAPLTSESDAYADPAGPESSSFDLPDPFRPEP